MDLHPQHLDLTGSIVDAAVRLHSDTGPGILESSYELLLADELERRGHRVEHQVAVPIAYRGRRILHGYRIDLLIDSVVIVEVKCTVRALAVHRRQVLAYLRLMRLQVGLVLNFGLVTMKDGIDRVLNDRMGP